MDALLTQLPAMVGVLIGVVGTLVTTTVAARRRREQRVRFDARLLDVSAEYAAAIREIVRTLASVTAHVRPGDRSPPLTPEEGKVILEAAARRRIHSSTRSVTSRRSTPRTGSRWTTAALAAEHLGITVGQIANSLVFLFDGVPTLVLTSGAHRVDTAWLGEQVGATITRASKEQVKEATGQVIGGVAPVGHPEPVPTYVDTVLGAHDEVWAAAGHARTVFPTTFEELVRITGGTPTAVAPDAS